MKYGNQLPGASMLTDSGHYWHQVGETIIIEVDNDRPVAIGLCVLKDMLDEVDNAVITNPMFDILEDDP